nr:Tn3 family transposase [Nonomuraea diastatica]
MAAKVIRPGALILAKMVGTARKAASDLTSQLVGHLLTAEVRADLERMLLVDAGLGMTRLEWLVSPARDASATSVKTAIDKLGWLRAIDSHQMDVSVLPNERRRFLAQVARRSTNQGLERRKERKFPILLAFVAQAAVDQLDEVVALFDQAVSARESRAKSKTDEALVERAKKGEARQLVMEMILPVLADPSIADDEVGGMLRERIGMQRLREITSDAWKPLPRDHGRLSELESSYTYLRQFTPNVLAAIDFQGGPGTAELMEAVAVLKEMNRLGGRKVPAGAPSGFMPAKYADYLAKARRPGEDTAYRHYWELCVILCLRDGLRSGDVFVPGSRRYADPATYLYTPEQWAPRRGEYCRLVGKPPNAAEALEQGKEELHAALQELETTLAGAAPDDTGMVRLDEDEHLVVPPLSAEDVPAEAKALRDELAAMLPFAPIASLLIELDARTHFLDCFTHAGGRKLTTSVETKRNILAVLIAMSTNLGLPHVGGLRGVLRRAGLDHGVVRAGGDAARGQHGHRRPPLRPGAGQSVRRWHHELIGWPAVPRPRQDPDRPDHGHSQRSGALHVHPCLRSVVDVRHEDHRADGAGGALRPGRLPRQRNRPPDRRARDRQSRSHTHQLCVVRSGRQGVDPRLRDLTRVTLVRDDTPTEIAKRYPHAGPLLGARWNEDLIADCWPDLQRMAGSLKYGQATASLIVGKWSAASRQNTLAAALKEWGMLRRTVHLAKYLSDPAFRRKISRQLNKGESLHALRRDLHYAQQGTITRPHLEQQTEQAWCLTLLTNSVVAWTTEYYSRAVLELRS